jgi:chromosome segregation ATPase
MPNTASITINSDRFQGLVKNVSSRVNAMKTRQLLQASITRNMKELSWIQDRLTVATAENEKVLQELNDIKNSLMEPKRQLDELTFEKETVQKSFDAEGLSETDIQKQSRKLQRLKVKVNQTDEEVSILKLTQGEYQSQLDVLVSQNKHYNEELANFGHQSSSLKSEIIAKKRICNLLDKIISESKDDRADIRSTVQSYITDTKAEMDTLVKSLDESNTEIARIQKELPSVTSEKNRLQREVNSAIAETGENYDMVSLEKTIQSHKAQEKTLIQENDAMKKEIQALESEIAGVDQKMNTEKETESRSARRYEYLLSQKQKMDTISNPDQEIKRLQEKLNDYQHEIKVSRDILDVSGSVKKELTDVCTILKSNVSFYDNELDALQKSLSSLLL